MKLFINYETTRPFRNATSLVLANDARSTCGNSEWKVRCRLSWSDSRNLVRRIFVKLCKEILQKVTRRPNNGERLGEIRRGQRNGVPLLVSNPAEEYVKEAVVVPELDLTLMMK